MLTASRDELGSVKWQVNSAAGVVFALSPTNTSALKGGGSEALDLEFEGG